MDYSVLMSAYKNSVLSEVEQSVQSMLNQTAKSNDIVLVIDGAIPQELSDGLKKLETDAEELHLFQIEKNVGLGNALRFGMKFCKNELIARLDTDDLSTSDRCEKQLKCFENDKDLSAVGGNIAEFIGDTSNIVSYRNVPQSHEDICEYLKSRCPLNHMTVMFKKSEVGKAGGYLDWHYNEDSYLWVRMYLAGCKFLNLNEVLANVRVNADTYKRRGGYKYYKSERDLFQFMHQNKIINWSEYQRAKFIRLIVQVLMPNGIRQWFFSTYARDKTTN